VGANVQSGEWLLLSENREAVLSALERGETDGILPAACGLMDRFAKFLLSTGIPPILDGFADYRKRRSIAPFLFCNLLLHKALFRLDSLSQIGPFLFSSPDVLRALGFNMRQIQNGVYSGSGERPLNVEALGDFFAMCDLEDFQANQTEVLRKLLEKYPTLLSEGTLIMDCIEIRIPPGHRGRKSASFEACVLCVLNQGEVLPVLWSFIPAKSKADITQGEAMMEQLLQIAGKDAKRLIVDRGFISGKWITELKTRGIDTVIGLKSDMVLYKDMISLASMPETIWLEAELPKRKNPPLSRHIAYLSDLDTWDGCIAPLAGIVIRDTYADKIEYQTVVTTDLTAEPEQIHEWIRSRWGIEETFMEESRHGSLNKIGPCRIGVGAAIAHFSLLAYTLLRLFAREEEAEKKTLRPAIPTAGIEFVAYWADYYAIIFPSELIEIVARCAASWGNKLPGILKKLKALEASL
jgi:hypothetical protein